MLADGGGGGTANSAEDLRRPRGKHAAEDWGVAVAPLPGERVGDQGWLKDLLRSIVFTSAYRGQGKKIRGRRNGG